MGWDGKLYADGDFVVMRRGTRVGPFSSHWAACAALIRLYEPSFQSLGGDRISDLKLEKQLLGLKGIPNAKPD
jgi:hypothetical protein